MLNKILNIAPGTDFKNSGKVNYSRYKESAILSLRTPADSFNLSPAVEFLNKIEWQLKKIEHANNKLVVYFSISGFDFCTSVDVDALPGLKFLNYDVSKEIKGKKKLSASFRIKFNSKKFHESLEISGLKGLKMFFEKIRNIENEKAKIDINESYLLNNLLYDINEELSFDFSFVNNSLLKFIGKLLNLDYSKNYFYDPGGNDLVVLLEVKIDDYIYEKK